MTETQAQGKTALLPDVATESGGKTVAQPRIMVIEDDPAVGDVIELHLRGAGFEIIRAADGLEALQVFEQEQPDLVTLDLDVPKVSGYRLIRLFKQASAARPIPIIIVTGADYEEAEEVVRAGADGFVGKPFNSAELIERVSFLLERSPASVED